VVIDGSSPDTLRRKVAGGLRSLASAARELKLIPRIVQERWWRVLVFLPGLAELPVAAGS
jgi:hypothetical protein